MAIQKRQPAQPKTRQLLTAADNFLRDRNFTYSHHYALRARDSDPTNPGPNRILAITTALSAAPHDYYAVFGLPRFEPDASRIRSCFRTLASNLNPNVNPYPIAVEALDLVLRAWSVLSNPSEKAAFDEELRRSLSASDVGTRAPASTFWTICPYCYHVYEYATVYEDCSLRCSNETCRRVLHAVPIQAPPPGVVEKGQYWCSGFIPFEISGSNGEELGEKPWTPFRPPVVSPSKGCDQSVSCYGGVIVDIFDKERAETDSKRRKIEVGVNSEIKYSNGLRTRRQKSVPWNSKKMMGRGVIIDENRTGLVYGVGEEEAGNLNENGLEIEFGDEVSNGVEFIEGDDVLIGLECDFDLGDGDMGF